MKERPILFSGAMVRALLSGAKTQTRRAVKWPIEQSEEAEDRYQIRKSASGVLYHITKDRLTDYLRSCSPYGQPGDRLWVRESLKRGFMPNIITGEPMPDAPVALYAADDAPVLFNPGEFDAVWQWERASLPSIHMPRWASRITLEVTGVRVERVQDISEEDARAEGVSPDWSACDHSRYSCADVGCLGQGYRAPFCDLWSEINGAESWDANVWVWVISFRRVTP